MKRLFDCINVTDTLALLMFLVYLITWNNHVTNPAFFKMYRISLFAIPYILFRLLYQLVPLLFNRIFTILLALCALWQVFYGLVQLTGFTESNNFLYAMTGSFNNPGPYGGFLSICISILIPAYSIEENRYVRWIYLIAGAVSLIMLPATLSRSAVLALIISLLVFSFTLEKVRVCIKKNWFVILIALLIAGTGGYYYKKGSADSRVHIAGICAAAIKDNGIEGSGLGSFSNRYGEMQSAFFEPYIDDIFNNSAPKEIENRRMIADCPEYAFNEYLEIGVECGIIGMMLFMLLTVSAIIILYRRGSVWCYGLVSLSIFAVFSYPFKLDAFCLIYTLFIAAAGALTVMKYRFRLPVASVIILLLSITILTGGYKRYNDTRIAEKRWNKSVTLYDMQYYDFFADECYAMRDTLSHKFSCMFALGQSLNKTGEYAKSDSVLNLGAANSCDPMFWNIMGNNALETGKYREAEECYLKAFYMVPNRLYPLTLLAELYYATSDSCSFKRMKDVVNNFKPKVESAQTERLREKINSLSFSSYSD